VRISRPCYDKWWRCPGWAGGGNSYARRQRCESGSLSSVINWDSRWKTWKIHRCPQCGVYVLPYRIRAVDPTNIRWGLKRLRWWWEDRRYR
jgi:hypothetical protein